MMSSLLPSVVTVLALHTLRWLTQSMTTYFPCMSLSLNEQGTSTEYCEAGLASAISCIAMDRTLQVNSL
jgi:hypothetical protein